jgi:cytoskeleton protein RodZ
MDRERMPYDGEFGVGATLKRARRERGLSLEDVEEATKIRSRYLQALEGEDFGALPDPVYVRGFVRTYADFLGLDGEELVRGMRSRLGSHGNHRADPAALRGNEFDRPLVNPGGLPGASRRRFPVGAVLALSLAAVVLVAALGALYFVGRGSQPVAGGGDAAPRVISTERETRATTGADTTDLSTVPETTARFVSATISVEGAASYLSVQSDGVVVYDQVARPGFSSAFEAGERLTVTAGNAGAVRVEANGREISPLGQSGQVVTRTFTPE